MDTIIFCFSGTGNSLLVSQEVKENLGNTEIVMMADAMTKDINLENKRVGFVFPAYYRSLPPIVERFIARISMGKEKYTFAIVTAGVMFGKSLDHLALLMSKQDGRLDTGYHIRMPGNYIAMYGEWPQWLQKYMLRKANTKISKISSDIIEKATKIFDTDAARSRKSLTIKFNNYSEFAKDYWINDNCTGCEQCFRLCPMRNITMVNSKPQFGENCERCMACIQWCPVKAIEYKNVTSKRKQYRNPKIKAKDLYHNNSNEN